MLSIGIGLFLCFDGGLNQFGEFPVGPIPAFVSGLDVLGIRLTPGNASRPLPSDVFRALLELSRGHLRMDFRHLSPLRLLATPVGDPKYVWRGIKHRRLAQPQNFMSKRPPQALSLPFSRGSSALPFGSQHQIEHKIFALQRDILTRSSVHRRCVRIYLIIYRFTIVYVNIHSGYQAALRLLRPY